MGTPMLAKWAHWLFNKCAQPFPNGHTAVCSKNKTKFKWARLCFPNWHTDFSNGHSRFQKGTLRFVLTIRLNSNGHTHASQTCTMTFQMGTSISKWAHLCLPHGHTDFSNVHSRFQMGTVRSVPKTRLNSNGHTHASQMGALTFQMGTTFSKWAQCVLFKKQD